MEWQRLLAVFGPDIGALVTSAALVSAYHLFLRLKLRRNPSYTIQAVASMARATWVETVMRQGGKDVLAVQTLRNSTMAATFLASTAVLMIIGVLTLSGQADKLGQTWHSLNVFGHTGPEIWIVKLLFLLIDLFMAFFSFAVSVRIFNHVGYMINVPLDARHRAISPRQVAFHLNRAGRYYSFGMRAYYYFVPLVFWLFGPHFLLLASIALIVVLYHLDRAPKIARDDCVDPTPHA